MMVVGGSGGDGEEGRDDGWVRGLLGQMDNKEVEDKRKVTICMHLGAGIRASDFEAALGWSGCWTSQNPSGLSDLDVISSSDLLLSIGD